MLFQVSRSGFRHIDGLRQTALQLRPTGREVAAQPSLFLNMNQTLNDVLEFDVQLTESDFRSAFRAWQFRKPLTWLLFTFGCLLLLSCLAELLRHHSLGPTMPAAVVGIFWVALPLALPVLQANKAKQDPESLACTHYRLNEITLQRTTNGTSVELVWNVLFGFRETSNAFLILPQKNCFFVIPKRSFENEWQQTQVTTRLKEKLRRR